jgi:hypothetical protein
LKRQHNATRHEATEGLAGKLTTKYWSHLVLIHIHRKQWFKVPLLPFIMLAFGNRFLNFSYFFSSVAF